MKRLFIRLSAIMLIASVMLGLSCKGENDVLSVSPSLRNIVFSADGTLSVAGSSDVLQFLVFTVETNRQWQVTANKTWVQALKTEGNVFTLSANPNDSVSPPEDAEVTVTAGNATPVKITVSQLGVDPLVVTPYNMVANIRSDPRTTMAFNWFTDRPATGKVEIVEGKVTEHAAFATPHKTVNATVNDISVRYNSSENRSYNVYKALVEGLTPGTTYSYRVGGYENVWSEIGLFTTAKNDKSDFTFLYTTDPQSTSVANFQLAAKTAQVAYTRFPDMKFWMNCGDLVDQSSGISAWEWEQFFGSQQDIFYKLPFAPVMGNHDAVMPNSFIYYFNTEPTVLAGTSPAKPGSVYSFVYGDVLFLALNFEDYNVSNYLTSIANWMRAEVNKPEHASIRWRVAFFHKAIYTGGSHQGDGDAQTVRNAMAPVFDELGIDIAIQGHDHIYEVIGPVYNKELVAGAVADVISTTVSYPVNANGKSGGIYNTENGTLYFLNSASGAKRYNPNNPINTGYGVPEYPGLFTGCLGQPGNPTYSNVSVTHDTIFIKTYQVTAASESIYDEIKMWKP